VREETRARVLAAARAANYAPNSRARRLATGRAMTIGHVIPLAGRTEMVNPIFADFLAGAGEVYAREGYDMLLSVVPNGERRARLSPDGRQRFGRRRDGAGPKVDDGASPLLQELGLPFLVHGRTGATRITAGSTSPMPGLPRATDFLLDLGHRRIALINGQESFDFAHRRRARLRGGAGGARNRPDPALMPADVMTEAYRLRRRRDHARRARPADAPSWSRRSCPPSACAAPPASGAAPRPRPLGDLP
jgi:LacI family transcriptional regulator